MNNKNLNNIEFGKLYKIIKTNKLNIINDVLFTLKSGDFSFISTDSPFIIISVNEEHEYEVIYNVLYNNMLGKLLWFKDTHITRDFDLVKIM